MSEQLVLAVLVLGYLLIHCLRGTRFETLATICIILSIGLVPFYLADFPASTYVIVTVVFCVVGLLFRRGLFRGILPFVPFFVLMGFSIAFYWEYSPAPWGNAVYLAAACGAWALGRYMGQGNAGEIDKQRLEEVVVQTVLLVGLVQLIVCLLQVAGMNLFPTSEVTAELTEGRASGTLGHPGNLGKLMVCLTALILPILSSNAKINRRLAMAALACLMIIVFLTLGRANIAAIVLLLGFWFVVSPRQGSFWVRIILPVLSVSVAYFFVDSILERFVADSDGGERNRFMQVALDHLPEVIWTGVGPQGYVNYFGQFDGLTAQGWPVHNTFLFLVAELGLLATACLLAPWVFGVLKSLPGARKKGGWLPHSRANIAFTVALLPIMLTGWGMAAGASLFAWFFVASFLGSSTGTIPSTVIISTSARSSNRRAITSRRR